MNVKTVPFTKEQIREIIKQYPTPFHIYDEKAIRENARKLVSAFSWAPGFKEFFAVKAAPNPYLMKLLKEEGFGADCSSLTELMLAGKTGITGEDIMFSSNDTPPNEFVRAREMGAVINLDDISHIDYLEQHAGLPELLSFRYNPGPLKEGNAIIGKPEEAKYGFTREQIIEGYKKIKAKGVTRFGLHTMVASNELNNDYFIETAEMLFALVREIHEKCGIAIEFVNLGGGFGIPYRPEDTPIDLDYISRGIKNRYNSMISGTPCDPLKIFMESGRLITGPYGYLVSTVLHKKSTYKEYVGLDACMANLMRPALYGAYHHITVMGKEDRELTKTYDVTGSLCENNDKFAIDRKLPEINRGDIVVIHDAGAHGHAMGFNYNGKLRSAELLLKEDGSVVQIRRAETPEDYFATLDFSKL
ncbi:MAG TPA: diaminopimelate decarboxylase [Spirochaetota bacterium]|nr:diaminopimelate decarboxylase [Spirochaetota bacterium]HQO03741.1 diaminopimelate decarboxylase [Spirochaetota bacterium]